MCLGGDMGMGFDGWVEVCGSGLGKEAVQAEGGARGAGMEEEWEHRNCSGAGGS